MATAHFQFRAMGTAFLDVAAKEIGEKTKATAEWRYTDTGTNSGRLTIKADCDEALRSAIAHVQGKPSYRCFELMMASDRNVAEHLRRK